MVGEELSLYPEGPWGGILISSPQGHSGKTLVAIALCHLLKEKGFSVQPFKKGPDYIDPSWLTIAAGRSCRNLDLFLIPEEKLIQNFWLACDEVDLAVVEGAMGLYDGIDEKGTTAGISLLFNMPILFVINSSRMTGSVAAMVKGYQEFQPGSHIAGVILNQTSGPRHEKKLIEAIEKYCHIPVVGKIPRDVHLSIPERHLGLIPSGEMEEAEFKVELIGKKLEPFLDLDCIIEIAKKFKSCRGKGKKEGSLREPPLTPSKVKIGVIRDQVFNFYYPENFEALVKRGAELLFFNSLEDHLPSVDGLYIGGGFPEFFLEKLEANEGLRKDIAKTIEEGLPVYAECAGLMYLCEKIFWKNQAYEMVGVLPAEVELSERPQGHGYVIAEVIGENPFFEKGLKIRGHEFHHSKLSIKNGVKYIYHLQRGHGIDGKRDGILFKNVLASYLHIHALGTDPWSEGFLSFVEKRKGG